jgi:hypothetical protein
LLSLILSDISYSLGLNFRKRKGEAVEKTFPRAQGRQEYRAETGGEGRTILIDSLVLIRHR